MFCYISKRQRQGLLPVCILIKIQRTQNSWLGCRGPELLSLSHQMPWQISKKQSPHCCLPLGNLVWGDKTLGTAEKCKLENTEGQVAGQTAQRGRLVKKRRPRLVGPREHTGGGGRGPREPMCLHARVCVHMGSARTHI